MERSIASAGVAWKCSLTLDPSVQRLGLHLQVPEPTPIEYVVPRLNSAWGAKKPVSSLVDGDLRHFPGCDLLGTGSQLTDWVWRDNLDVFFAERDFAASDAILKGFGF